MRNPLQPEEGVTPNSSHNAEILHTKHGRVISIELKWDPDGKEWYEVPVTYADGHQHVFTGFSWGYGGTGPRGLAEFAKNEDIPISMKEISGFRNEGPAGVIWSFKR